MSVIKLLINKIAPEKQNIKNSAQQNATLKQSQDMLKHAIEDLDRFTKEEIPAQKAQQEELIANFEKLSQIAKSLSKK